VRGQGPLFDDLVNLCVLPAAVGGGAAGAAGRWLPVRHAGFDGVAAESERVSSRELQEHQMYLAFKKSGRKKYERQFSAREFWLSDVTREETPKEHFPKAPREAPRKAQ
jgi:hypothetical protein